jgi:PASTA domain
MAPSAPALVDPLAAQDAVPVVASTPAPVVVRGERVAPDVRGELGEEAVRIVRAGGFIAAIEPVVSDTAREGTVIEQFPPPGVRVERETVLTLRLASAPQASEQARQSVSKGEHADGSAAVLAERDDTKEWFAGVAAAGRGGLGGGASGRRRRKHRTPKPPVGELAFDAPPEPQAMPTVVHIPVAGPVHAVGPRFGAWRALRAGVGVFAARAHRLAWRRVGAAIACVLCVTAGVRVLGSRQRGAPAVKRGALVAQAPRPVKPQVKAPASPRRPRRVSSAGRRVPTGVGRPLHWAGGVPRAPRVAPSPRVAAAVIGSPDASEAAVQRVAVRRPVVNQFAYLGR